MESQVPARYRLATAVLVTFLFASSQPSVSADTVRVYQTEDLGVIAGGNYLVGIALNCYGDVTGYAIGSDGFLRAFRWTASGGLEDLGFNGGQASTASAINDNGDVVGHFWDQDGEQHPFIAKRGEAMTDLTSFYPEIFTINSINNAGQLTGYTKSGHAFKTQPGGALQEFGTYFSFGASLNEAGEIGGVGWHDEEMSQPRTAFRYSDSTGLVDLGTLSGGTSGALAINEGGVIVGWSGGTETIPGRAFRAKPGLPMEDLGSLPGGAGWSLGASAINDRGAIVGQGDGRYGPSPFLFTDAQGMIDLRYRITMAEQMVFPMDWAMAINNSGQILAGYHRADEGYGTVRLTPLRREFDGPVAAPTAEPSVLRPVHNQMVSVSVDPHVTDEYDPEPVCRIVRVVNSQAPHAGPDPDVEITYHMSVNLRASRRGPGNSRTYTIKVGCTDALGVTSRSEVVVVVPHGNGSND